MGRELLQKVDRESFADAMKASAMWRNGVWQDIYKVPVTARGSKRSKRGVQGAMINSAV